MLVTSKNYLCTCCLLLLGLRIFGGNDVDEISEFPYIAQYMLNDSAVCGAVIISETKLITCAHCLPDDHEMSITTQKIRAGAIQPDEGGEVRNVSRFILHPRFDEPVDLNNDIAILFIDAPLNLTTKNMKKIAIAQPELDDLMYSNPDSEFMLCGYGFTERINAIVKLRWLQEPLVDQNICSNIYANIKKPMNITKKMFCAGNELFKFVRQGDSGGNFSILEF